MFGNKNVEVAKWKFIFRIFFTCDKILKVVIKITFFLETRIFFFLFLSEISLWWTITFKTIDKVGSIRNHVPWENQMEIYINLIWEKKINACRAMSL